MYFFLHRDQSCYDIIPLYNAMKKKVLSDSDEVSGCVFKTLALNNWRNRTAVSVLLGTKVPISVTVREWSVLLCQLNVSCLSAGKLGKNSGSSPLML